MATYMDAVEGKHTDGREHLDMDYINLVDRVLDQIVEDVHNGDLTAIQELLVYCEVEAMKQYLPEEKQ